MEALVKKNGGRTGAQLIARAHFVGASLFMSRQTLGCLTVIKAETYVAVKAPRPCVEPIALTADERVERVEKKGPYTFQRAALYRALSGQPVEDGNHEAFRFPRSRAAADDGGGRLLPAKSFPGFKLVCVRPARRRELVVLPQFLGRLVEAAGQAFTSRFPARSAMLRSACFQPNMASNAGSLVRLPSSPGAQESMASRQRRRESLFSGSAEGTSCRMRS